MPPFPLVFRHRLVQELTDFRVTEAAEVGKVSCEFLTRTKQIKQIPVVFASAFPTGYPFALFRMHS